MYEEYDKKPGKVRVEEKWVVAMGDFAFQNYKEQTHQKKLRIFSSGHPAAHMYKCFQIKISDSYVKY